MSANPSQFCRGQNSTKQIPNISMPYSCETYPATHPRSSGSGNIISAWSWVALRYCALWPLELISLSFSLSLCKRMYQWGWIKTPSFHIKITGKSIFIPKKTIYCYLLVLIHGHTTLYEVLLTISTRVRCAETCCRRTANQCWFGWNAKHTRHTVLIKHTKFLVPLLTDPVLRTNIFYHTHMCIYTCIYIHNYIYIHMYVCM